MSVQSQSTHYIHNHHLTLLLPVDQLQHKAGESGSTWRFHLTSRQLFKYLIPMRLDTSSDKNKLCAELPLPPPLPLPLPLLLLLLLGL